MKRLLRNKPAVKISLLFTTAVALSIWVGSNSIFVQQEKSANDSNHPLGGEGLILQQPTTRNQFAADFL